MALAELPLPGQPGQFDFKSEFNFGSPNAKWILEIQNDTYSTPTP